MQINNIIFSIENIINILQFFVPGFILIAIFQWLSSKKCTNFTVLFILSCVFSYVINIASYCICGAPQNSTQISWKVIIASLIISVVCGVAASKICSNNLFNRILSRAFHITTNSILLDVFDVKNGSNLAVYCKNKDCYFIGQLKKFSIVENPNWIYLVNFKIYNKENEVLKSCSMSDAGILIKFDDIEFIEVY